MAFRFPMVPHLPHSPTLRFPRLATRFPHHPALPTFRFTQSSFLHLAIAKSALPTIRFTQSSFLHLASARSDPSSASSSPTGPTGEFEEHVDGGSSTSSDPSSSSSSLNGPTGELASGVDSASSSYPQTVPTGALASGADGGSPTTIRGQLCDSLKKSLLTVTFLFTIFSFAVTQTQKRLDYLRGVNEKTSVSELKETMMEKKKALRELSDIAVDVKEINEGIQKLNRQLRISGNKESKEISKWLPRGGGGKRQI